MRKQPENKPHEARDPLIPRLVLFFLLVHLIYAHPIYTQESIFTNLLSTAAPAGELWADHPQDSTGTAISIDMSGLPLYHEWNDTSRFQEYYGARGYARVHRIHRNWKFGAEYSYQTLRVLAHPVTYQLLHTRLERSHASLSLSRSLPANFLTAAKIGYNTTSNTIDYWGGGRWSGMSWIQPEISHSHQTTTHRTRFELYDSAIEFGDYFSTDRTTFSLASHRNKRLGYTLQYSTGRLRQPTAVQTPGETQSTALDLRDWNITLRIPFFREVDLTGAYSVHTYDGDSEWFTNQTKFADFTRLNFKDIILAAGIRWHWLQYMFHHEIVEHSIYGQIRSIPFSAEAIDLLGTTFAANSKGSLRIRSHSITVRAPHRASFSYRGELAYTTIRFHRLDYRTYVLFLGFPRRETLRISDTNIRRTHLLRLFLQLRIPVTPHFNCVPMIQQYIPISTEYVEEPPPSEGFLKAGRRYFGGNRFSLRFEYDL
ncbi:MAG TPA: hypothetical protein VKA68_13185 [bacterium]|nr:hypothetical protein [bacterium]